jgi:glycosyltransferase involved in cell wall biosynthesis
VAERLAGRAEVLAVEVASASDAYAWEPSGLVAGATKLTLFPGRNYDAIGLLARFWRQWQALRRCRMVCIGISYHNPDVIVLAWLLRLVRTKVVLMSESKFDDLPRRSWFELFKTFLMLPAHAMIVGGLRQITYYRALGFVRRPLLPGYDTVSVARIRAELAEHGDPGMAHADRAFLFIGRFVPKKNLAELIDGYALYARQAGPAARRLVLVGSGPEDAALRAQCARLGIAELVDFPGFLGPDGVARQLGRALALVLISRVEQWGLVVNEALAAGLPVIAAPAVGACDALVRNTVNGFLVEPGSRAGLAAAMHNLATGQAEWERLANASTSRAELGDVVHFADAVEVLYDGGSAESRARIAGFLAAMGHSEEMERADAADYFR